MFILRSSYTGTAEQLAEHIDAHHDWALRYYESGHFLVGGRRVPATGGIGVARARSREEIEHIVSEDPWLRFGLIEYTIEEFEESGPPGRSSYADDFLRSALATLAEESA